MPTIKQSTIDNMKKHINNMLRQPLPQDTKVTLCCMLENILMETDQYKGYNYNYWLQQGCNDFHNNPEDYDKDKDDFIYGPEGNKHRPKLNKCPHKDWVNCIEGEFSRYYY